jgi:arylsulfatase A-like enzyme
MSEKPNILLLIADELRADRLGCYGYAQAATPFLDSLAAGGVLGEAFFTPAVSTHAAVASLLTGEHPLNHGIVSDRSTADFPGEIPFLTELFLKDGYATASFGNLRHERPWFGQGCEFAVNPGLAWLRKGDRVCGRELSAWAKRWIRGHANESFLAWVHYTDLRGQAPEQYDQTVHDLDDSIRDLVSVLDELRLTGKTLVLFTAARGEQRGLSDRALRVPAIFRWPGRLPEGICLPQVFQTQAIGHALLELGELPTPYNDDPSLWKLLSGQQQTEGLERVFSLDCTDGPQWGLRTRCHKFILPRGSGARKLYDLTTDPREQQDIATQRPEIADTLENELEAWIAHRLDELGKTSDPLTDPELRKAS